MLTHLELLYCEECKMMCGNQRHVRKSAEHLMEWKLGHRKLGETDQTPSVYTDTHTYGVV